MVAKFSAQGQRILKSILSLILLVVLLTIPKPITASYGEDWGGALSPAWSPDGKHIAYYVGINKGAKQEWHLYVVNADGTNPTDLYDRVNASGVGYTPIWTHESKLFQNSFIIIDPDNPKNISFNETKMHYIGYGEAWAPDGSHLAYICGMNPCDGLLQVTDADGFNERQLTSNEYLPVRGYKWSPNSKQIAFYSNWGNSVSVVNVDTGTIKSLLRDINTQRIEGETTVSWSPDSQHVAVSRAKCNEKEGVCVIDINNAKSLKFIDGAFPAWSPTSNEIAYSNKSFQICVMNINTSAEHCIVAGYQGIPIALSWSPNGKLLMVNVMLFPGMVSGLPENFTKFEIYVMNADGSQIIKLLDSLLEEF